MRTPECGYSAAVSPGELPSGLARKIGAAPELPALGQAAMPQTMLDWAISWAALKLCVFPCKRFLGTPIPSKWYREATFDIGQLVEWWSETPDVDIAAIPDRSGHFVIRTVGSQGRKSLKVLEKEHGELSPVIKTEAACSSLHLWFRGRALTSRNLLGEGLHVCGPGTFVYMPASLAPDPE